VLDSFSSNTFPTTKASVGAVQAWRQCELVPVAGAQLGLGSFFDDSPGSLPPMTTFRGTRLQLLEQGRMRLEPVGVSRWQIRLGWHITTGFKWSIAIDVGQNTTHASGMCCGRCGRGLRLRLGKGASAAGRRPGASVPFCVHDSESVHQDAVPSEAANCYMNVSSTFSDACLSSSGSN
jgi:hypothetical protein